LRILVSNDDGIHAPGLSALALALAEEHEVYVFAPDRERSATGHSLTLNRPLRIEPHSLGGRVVQSWSVNGTPSDCIKIALSAILSSPPDLVLSGINRGANLGSDVIYSGTVSAAIEGTMNGIPSIAISLASFDFQDYLPAARFALSLANRMKMASLPPRTLLNVNVPPGNSPSEVRITRLGERRYLDIFEERVDLRGRPYYWLSGELASCEEKPDSDVSAVAEGAISVTPIHYDLTHYDAMAPLQDWDFSPP
jgi:5'-nucleotidase